MSHVAPHRWAEALAGRLDADTRARMVEHAATCRRCATARDRITGAREAFSDIARVESPELRWEQIGARVYWASSQERRTRERTTAELRAVERRRRGWLLIPALAGLAVGASALTIMTLTDRRPMLAPEQVAALGAPAEIVPVELVEVPDPEAAAALQPVPLVGLVTMAQGDARLGGAASASLFDTPVVAGLALETGDGRMAIQLDAGTGFAIGPSSRLTVARLDAAAIVLHVEGEVSVEVAHRAAGQRFAVVAGGRVVEVRGTAFQVVHHGGRVEVACRHGVVAVRDGAEVVEVTAGKRWTASDDEPLLAHPPAPLTAEQIARLIAHQPTRLPAWSEAAAMLRTTGPVQIAAPHGRAIKVDGVVVGDGGLTLRVMSGRHLVEAEQSAGRFARGQWVETSRDGAIARVEPLAGVADAGTAATRRAGVAARRKQLDRAVDRQRLARCLRSLAKQGVSEGTHIVLELGVDDTGAVSYLNVGDTDLPASVAECVRDTVASVTFAAGPAASWTHRFGF